MIKFKENLRAYRQARCMTQKELAKRTGLTDVWISHYENGRRLPSVLNLIKLADALNISIDELVRREK